MRISIIRHKFSKNLHKIMIYAFAIFVMASLYPALSQEKPQEKTATEKSAPAGQEENNSRDLSDKDRDDMNPEKESLWTFLWKGGSTMIGLGVISTIILAFAMERAMFFKKQKIQTKGFYELVVSSLNEGGLENLEKKISQDKSLIARVISSGLSMKHLGRERMERSFSNNASIELGKLENGLNLLNNLGNLAPLLGFFGTVTGMRHSFLEFVLKAAPTARDLAGGVEEALITTIVGLFIAIPAYLIYNLFLYYIDNLTIEIERCANTIMDRID